MKIQLAGHEVELLPEGAIWMASAGLLCVADLHFEKSTFFRKMSTLLPPYDSQATLEKLAHLIKRYPVQTLVAAGDSFHDPQAALRMKEADRSSLTHLMAQVSNWYWLSGNHDPWVMNNLQGQWQDELEWEGIHFRHQTKLGDGAEVSGHFHPKVTLSLRGHRLSARCFVKSRDRLILPSFGAYTGGLNIESEAFTRVAPSADREVYLVSQDRVFSL